MAKDVSIAFKASDNLSNSIRQMKKNVNGLSRDVSEYRKVQDKAFNKRAEIKFDITKAKNELKELTKAVKNNVEGSEKAFKEKQKALEELQEEYRRLGQAAKEASKAEKNLQEDLSRSSNANATRNSGGNNLAKSLMGAGLANMLGGALSNNLAYNMTSVFGGEMGSAVNNIAGGMASGAAMGSIAGLPGAIAGALTGALSGVINTATEKQQKKDDLFREEIQSIYSKVSASNDMILENGLPLASKREKDLISYETILGSKNNANRFLQDTQNFSAKTPFELNDLLDTSKVMLSYKYAQDEIIPLMTKIGDAGSALGIDSANQRVVATAIGRMKSSGKTSLEYINQLSERAIPAIDYLAEHFGKTQKQIYEMISKSKIDGAEASKVILDAMGKEFEGSMAKQSATFDGLVSTLTDAKGQIDMAMGEGYLQERKKGMQSEIKLFNSDVGQELKEANKLIGQYKADLENQYQKSIIDSITEAQKSSEYLKAEQEKNGAEMGRILSKAKAEAEIKHKNSESYKMQLEADKNLVRSIKDAMIQDGGYQEYGRAMAKEFEQGWSGALESAMNRNILSREEKEKAVEEHGTWWQKFMNPKQTEIVRNNGSNRTHENYKTSNGRKIGMGRNAGSYATGIDRVPYNNFPAILHEGEKVLTRSESDRQPQNVAPNVIINVHNYAPDTYQITSKIRDELVNAAENFYGGKN